MKKNIYLKIILSACMLLTIFDAKSQIDSSKSSYRFFKFAEKPNQKRIKSIVYSESAVYLAGNFGLYHLWYKDYGTGKFHFFNDNNEWMHMDKCGHATVAYNLGYHGYKWLRWGGLDEKRSILYGGSLGFIFLSSVEVMDGFSSGWGFSWGDMLANTAGTSLFMMQQAIFKDNPVKLKFSYHTSSLTSIRPELLGSNLQERLLKDYNGQTYWLSVNLRSVSHWQKLPPWLCVALGYSINGFVGAEDNIFVREGKTYDYSNIKRYNQCFLSMDVDLSKIHSKRPWLNSLIHTFGFLKIPFPTLEYNKVERFKGHLFYF
jgi:hypothetical protein